ncbi:hypothetical protein GPECTOR_5g138 [Gonium pectorale]|uniref:Uncharacterized protein n=1 Tax=Gonium pectorale TaxID=33097 RepID=A0A150GWH8_GONPE|nr:hypothetical protein GPECTOR_5g138 [Gonium pectorale]|eukprot:KXZ54028.1 hypothetical protein GPECTOR_5g138 [Gonium pectorale]
MDLLGGYGDSDGEEQDVGLDAADTGPSTTSPASKPTSAAPRLNAAPDPDSRISAPPAPLFNPFADDEAGGHGSPTTTSPPGGSKRGFTQVTGSSGAAPRQPGPAKASRTAAAPGGGPKPAGFNTALVPPQLRNGRANVSTEDMEKMFSKGALKRQRAAAGTGAAGAGAAAGGSPLSG